MTSSIPVAFSQFILPFSLDQVCTFDNLVVGDANRRAVEAVRTLSEALEVLPTFPVAAPLVQTATALILTGEEGTGKTHLLQAAITQRQLLSGVEHAVYFTPAMLHEQLQGSEEQDLTRFLDGCDSCRLVAVDGLDELESCTMLQEGVLYLFNLMRATGGRMLVAGRKSPSSLGGLRPDLRSRLLWGPLIPVGAPEDEMLGAILAKMVEDRQVRCAPELLKFLQLRLPRRIPDYVAALDRLNDASLGLKRPLTVPLAKKVLGL